MTVTFFYYTGLFKREYEGAQMHALTSKTYLISKEDPKKFKMSCKGVQKHRVVDPHNIFKSVLETGEARSSTNMGFRARNNTMYTYTQERCAFPYIYLKRKVHADGRTTSPLDIVLTPREKHPGDFDDKQELIAEDDEGNDYGEHDQEMDIDC